MYLIKQIILRKYHYMRTITPKGFLKRTTWTNAPPLAFSIGGNNASKFPERLNVFRSFRERQVEQAEEG